LCVKAVKLALQYSGLAKKIGSRPVTMSVHVITNMKMCRLNMERRKKDKATDVLSFPMLMWQDKGSEVIELGDIFVSPEYIKKAAKEEVVTYQQHLRRLLVHGIVHLLDYDHKTEGQYRKMNAVERKILAKL
jgi:probable rRNA maturation factor